MCVDMTLQHSTPCHICVQVLSFIRIDGLMCVSLLGSSNKSVSTLLFCFVNVFSICCFLSFCVLLSSFFLLPMPLHHRENKTLEGARIVMFLGALSRRVQHAELIVLEVTLSFFIVCQCNLAASQAVSSFCSCCSQE